MCGICGSFELDAEAPGGSVDRMLEAIAHRGRDGSGRWQLGGITLGHRRLAILDLSPAGIQPMQSRSGRYTIVFNGEIYNYREIAAELKLLGVTFSSTGDTQVLLAAFETWGVFCLTKLRGMFAFAVFDSHSETITCARDPLGIKPLYYYLSPDKKRFLFASEIKGLLASNLLPRVADRSAIAAYHRFYSVPQPQTIIKEVFALMPGHYMVVKQVDSLLDITQQRYIAPLSSKMEVETVPERSIFDRLSDAVLSHLVSDVPIGLFLSGGLDSAALGVIMHNLDPEPFHTFSIGFSHHSSLDESPVAAFVAKRLNSIHHRCLIGPDEFLSNLETFISAIDQPSGDGLNLYFVSKFASTETKVAFSGLGGDELFLGYRYMNEIRRMIAWQRSTAFSLLAGLLRPLTNFPRVLHHLNLRFLNHFFRPDNEIYLALRSLRQIDTPHDLGRLFTSPDRLNNFSLAELDFYLPSMLLRDSDATSMFSTLELRVPFLDLPLVSDIISIPSGNKPPGKRLQVNLLGDLLPQEIARLPKRGFEMPVGYWITKKLDFKLDRLTDTPGLAKDQIKSEVALFRRNPRDYLQIWSLIVLNMWLEMHDVEVEPS